MTELEIQRARQLIEEIRPDPWWGPDADARARVGDLRMLIFFLNRALSHIEGARKQEIRKTQCKFDLGKDWG